MTSVANKSAKTADLARSVGTGLLDTWATPKQLLELAPDELPQGGLAAYDFINGDRSPPSMPHIRYHNPFMESGPRRVR